jgi:single-stranded-DNA-specific exonuclease
MLTPEIAVDAEIDFADITPKLIRILKQFDRTDPKI